MTTFDEWDRALDELDALTRAHTAFFRGHGSLPVHPWTPPSGAPPVALRPRLLALAAENDRLTEAVQRQLASSPRPTATSPYA